MQPLRTVLEVLKSTHLFGETFCPKPRERMEFLLSRMKQAFFAIRSTSQVVSINLGGRTFHVLKILTPKYTQSNKKHAKESSSGDTPNQYPRNSQPSGQCEPKTNVSMISKKTFEKKQPGSSK